MIVVRLGFETVNDVNPTLRIWTFDSQHNWVLETEEVMTSVTTSIYHQLVWISETERYVMFSGSTGVVVGDNAIYDRQDGIFRPASDYNTPIDDEIAALKTFKLAKGSSLNSERYGDFRYQLFYADSRTTFEGHYVELCGIYNLDSELGETTYSAQAWSTARLDPHYSINNHQLRYSTKADRGVRFTQGPQDSNFSASRQDLMISPKCSDYPGGDWNSTSGVYDLQVAASHVGVTDQPLYKRLWRFYHPQHGEVFVTRDFTDRDDYMSDVSPASDQYNWTFTVESSGDVTFLDNSDFNEYLGYSAMAIGGADFVPIPAGNSNFWTGFSRSTEVFA